jgi:hypothetical protein
VIIGFAMTVPETVNPQARLALGVLNTGNVTHPTLTAPIDARA